MISTSVSNETLVVFRQQIDHSNHEMFNTLTNHMALILNPLLRSTNEIYQQMNGILTRIRDALAIPRNQLGNRHVIQEVPIQEEPINNNNPESDINIPTWIMNDREQPNPILVNRNQNIDEVLANM